MMHFVLTYAQLYLYFIYNPYDGNTSKGFIFGQVMIFRLGTPLLSNMGASRMLGNKENMQ
jgi:hypothetical protein